MPNFFEVIGGCSAILVCDRQVEELVGEYESSLCDFLEGVAADRV